MKELEIVYTSLQNSDKPLKGGEISSNTSLEKKAMDKALKILLKEGKIHSPKRCFYETK